MEQAWWVVIAVAFVGGQGFGKVLEIFRDWRTGRTRAQRAEVDRMAKHLAEANARVRVAERRERLATEWGHKNAVLAIRMGVPESAMPVLDFRDG